jgi:peptidoglycan/LPS O-acetylase OafA/YrhL
MVLLRKVVAVGALLALAGLIWTLERGSYGVNPRLVIATRVLLFPLGVAITGVLLEQYWGRWLALAAALVVLPWALVLTFGLPPGVPLRQQTIALIASGLLLLTLSGRVMFERYEGRAATDWTGLRMGLVRWTIILNMASAAALFLFVALYRYTIEWHVVLPAVLLVALVAGVLMLTRQKTLGLVLVALACVLFVPAAAFFVWMESSYAGGVRIFAMSFIPGVVAGWACLFAFGRPIWRTLRTD